MRIMRGVKLYIIAVFFLVSLTSTASAAQLPDNICFNLFTGTFCLNATTRAWDKNGTVLWYGGGSVGIGTKTPAQELEVDGDIRLDATGSATTNGLCHSGADADGTFSDRDIVACSGSPGDIAEWHDTIDKVNPGEIVVTTVNLMTYSSPNVDALTGMLTGDYATLRISKLTKSWKPFQTNAIGIVSSSPAKTYGRAVIQHSIYPVPVALAGQVPLKVTNENGAITPGDLLTTSSTPGHGMKFSTVSAKEARDFEELKEIIDENERRRNSVIAKALEPCTEQVCTISVVVSLQ